jgi:hypothetical protein
VDATREEAIESGQKALGRSKTNPRSLSISEAGIKTGSDFANLMSALMSDIIAGRVTPSTGNAACNAGSKLLKVVEMQFKYGTNGIGQGEKELTLAPCSGKGD